MPYGGRPGAFQVLVGRVRRRSDVREHRQMPLDGLLDSAGGRPSHPEQGRRRRLPHPPVAGGGEDRGQGGGAVRVPGRHRLRDHAAHGHADQMGAVDAEVVEEAVGVGGHVAQVVGVRPGSGQQLPQPSRRRCADPAGASGVPVVVPDHPETALDEAADHPLRPGGEVETQAGDEEKRGPVGRTLHAVADPDVAREVDEPVLGRIRRRRAGQLALGAHRATAVSVAVAGAASTRVKCSSGSTTLSARSSLTSEW
ncbi:hypothetical protein QFZ74_000553 [Streptomyces sp. V3I7]|nr:hypothetical protein [Streptomyces sp. V3I7]